MRADQSLAQSLSRESFEESRKDARVRTAFARWSRCMRREGFRYAGPLDPPDDPRFRGAPSGAERAVAVADVRCKAATRLVGVWSAVEAARQRELIRAHLRDLTKIAEMNEYRLARARDLRGAP
ncbi:hypothetical protein [Actinomadura fibrosa]|uniref:Uncharacterized protein n=1 Tax=Actinomadura fibrosa TaxID=111802 RepID=A0ABW2Y1A8_9ACTN|nr:hypothetical protein [Actinomadura fibrosa]